MTTVNVTILAIGGGGAGGSYAGGGGSGGGASTGTATFDSSLNYRVVVGNGGTTNSPSGQASYVSEFPIIAYGGLGGGGSSSGPIPGGSAEGGIYNAMGGTGGAGPLIGYNAGGNGQTVGTITGAGGGGGSFDVGSAGGPGGAGGGLAGVGGTGAAYYGGNPTAGSLYGGGGGGSSITASQNGYGGAAGASGVVTISYTSEIQLYQGGTVSSSGSGASTLWTHTFTNNGELRANFTGGLPTSGPLSLLDIQTEFGGTTPISLGEYYKGGAYVNVYSYAPNVPYSGTIKISEFYGARHYVPQPRTITLSDGQSFTVPPTIASTLFVTLQAGAGGNGGNDVCPGYPGYPGHLVIGYLIVSPGDVILASIGGSGVGGGSGSGPGTQGQGGYGGVLGYSGGSGGWAGYAGWSGGGGGGGGATVITKNGIVVGVAGGGAGGGGGGWHSNGRPSQGYSSTGVPQGGQGQNKDGHDGDDGGGAGGGGGGQFGGNGGSTYGGDEGAWSGSDGADLIPSAGSSTTSFNAPSVTIQGTW